MKKKVSKKKVHTIQTEYLGQVYSPKYLDLIPKAVKEIRQLRKKLKFDAIAFTGSSGAALAFPLSYFLKLPLIHVRKGQSHYGSGPIEGTISSQRYLIVDDFIDRGNTIRRIIKKIESELGGEAKPVGIYLYDATFPNNFNFHGEKIPVYRRDK